MGPSKRLQPRVPVETLCSEVVEEQEQLGLVVDLAPTGLRIVRPLSGRRPGRIVQLEFELPDVDEIVWAKGEICFDAYRREPDQPNAVRTTGVRLVAAASRHLRMLRDWVMATAEQRRRLDEGRFDLAHAAHWAG